MQELSTCTISTRLNHVWRFLVHSLVVTAILCLGAVSAWSQEYMDEREPQRRALVIGNADYTIQTTLPSSAIDAGKMKDRLGELGFVVVEAPNLKTKTAFTNAISAFRASIEEGDLVVFYFSGHGFSYKADGFLAPTELPISVSEAELPDTAITIDSVRSMLEAQRPGLIIMILDACRTIGFVIPPTDQNPSTPSHTAAGNGVSLPADSPIPPTNLAVQGLKEPRAGGGSVNSLVAFAAEPGHVSIGNSGAEMSKFTRWLVAFLPNEGKSVISVFFDAGSEVNTEDSSQKPTVYSYSFTDPYLRPSLLNRDQEKLVWYVALDSKDKARIKRYTVRHSVTRHTAAARRWLHDHQQPETKASTRVSAFAVERLWSIKTSEPKAVRQLETSAFAFPSSMEMGLEKEGIVAADKEVGIVRSGSRQRDLALEKTGEEYLTSKGIEATNNELSKLAFTIASMDIHGDVVATRSLTARERPDDTAERVNPIKKGTPLQIQGLAQGPNNSAWMQVFSATNTSPVFVKLEPSFAETRPIVELGQSLKEIIVTAVPRTLPDLIDEKPLIDTVKELKNQGWEINWVSLSTGAVSDETHQAIRDARLAHAQYVLKQVGIPAKRITALTAMDDFKEDGVRIRFFGVRK
jgi:hypothetical protein